MGLTIRDLTDLTSASTVCVRLVSVRQVTSVSERGIFLYIGCPCLLLAPACIPLVSDLILLLSNKQRKIPACQDCEAVEHCEADFVVYASIPHLNRSQPCLHWGLCCRTQKHCKCPWPRGCAVSGVDLPAHHNCNFTCTSTPIRLGIGPAIQDPQPTAHSNSSPLCTYFSQQQQLLHGVALVSA